MTKKNIVRIALLLLLSASVAVLSAESVFVTSKVAVLYDQASTGAKRLAALKQGQELTVVSRAGDWVQVTVVGTSATGWVGNLFVGVTASIARKDLGAGMADLTNIATRTRASAYTTSAAGTRGLSADNVRQRENLSFSEYDFTVAPWLETFVFSDEDIESFAASQGIVPVF